MPNRFLLFLVLLTVSSLILPACTSTSQVASVASPTTDVLDKATVKDTPPTVKPSPTEASPTPQPTEEPASPSPEPTQAERPTVTVTPPPDERPPRGAEAEFKTDFSIHAIPYSEILSGGPPKDGIPAIDEPNFIDVGEADEWLKPVEPVILIQVGEEARAYPLQILMWHEIVNDTINEVPLVVTFCPLCNTAIAFDRTVNGEVFDFGTSGRLRNSNLIMYDRQTETWWQQATGEAVIGDLTGTQLTFYPAAIISWEDFKSNFSQGQVLSRDTGYTRSYGQNPYAGYDNINSPPFLYRGPETPDTLPAVARVLTVDIGDEAVAYPYAVLEEAHVINDSVAGQDIVVFWEAGTASALDNNVLANGRDVGAANVYSRQVNGQTLTFSFVDNRIIDDLTGSQWDVLGKAIDGELAGTQLSPIVAINHFWFSWAAFKPETRIYQP